MLNPSYLRETETIRETRTPVRLPDRKAAGLFPGWGPKF
jgi:hypothetical protein